MIDADTTTTTVPRQQPGEAPTASPGDSVAAEKLIAELQSLYVQAQPLMDSIRRTIRAHGELAIFMAREAVRLYFARQFIWVFSVVSMVCAWIFFSMFLWRAGVSLTGQPAVGPLVLAVTHFAAGAALLSWRERFKL